MLLYITTNKNKVATANTLLKNYNIVLKGFKIDGIIEPQTEDIEEISTYKAKQAFEKVHKPLIVSDSSWLIPGLNGFPGPYMAYVNRWFTSQDFLNLMEDKKDNRIILKECITYIDNSQTKNFFSEITGYFVEKELGKATPLDQVISFRDDGKTIAQCENENLIRIPQNELWNEVGEWLTKN